MEDVAQQPSANDRSYGSVRDDVKKVFVGGLGRTITEEELREYFTQYGEIENINIKTHPFSGESRGFAFVQFVNAKSVDDLLATKNHYIANKKVEPMRAFKRVNPLRYKIFVTGLTSEMTEQDVRNHFVQFGSIIEYRQPFDKTTNQKQSYCFITFEDSEVVNKLMENPKQVINGKGILVRRYKFNPETMTANGARTGPMGGNRAPATFGMRSAYPGYVALSAASPYGTAARYDYAANAYVAYGAYGGDDYFANGYSDGGYRGGHY